MGFESLPKNIHLRVFDFLEWTDLLALRKVCRKCYQITSEQKIWVREALRCFFSHDLEMIRYLHPSCSPAGSFFLVNFMKMKNTKRRSKEKLRTLSAAPGAVISSKPKSTRSAFRKCCLRFVLLHKPQNLFTFSISSSAVRTPGFNFIQNL